MTPSPVTQLLLQMRTDEKAATDELLPLVYHELRRLALARLSHEDQAHTLQPTALVHEAYLRLVGKDGAGLQWDHRGHFFAAAAEAMRRILVESARRKARLKYGGGWQQIPAEHLEARFPAVADDLLSLDEVLTDFSREAPDKAELVKLRYFAGLSEEEAAEVLGISRATAARWWAYARAWLFDRLSHSDA